MFGKVAGEEAARFAREHPRRPRIWIRNQRRGKTRARHGHPRRRHRAHCHVARNGHDHGARLRHLSHGRRHASHLRQAGRAQDRFARIRLTDTSSVFNTEWLAAIELGYQLDVALAMAHSALLRKGVARCISGSMDLPRAMTSTSSSQHCHLPAGRRTVHRLSGCEDHAAAAGHPRLWRCGAEAEKRTGHKTRQGSPGDVAKIIDVEVLRCFPSRPEQPFSRHATLPTTDDMSVCRVAAHQRRDRQHIVVPLVLPHGHLRQLRHDDQRCVPKLACNTFLRLRRKPVRVGAEPLSDRARSCHRRERFCRLKLERIQPCIVDKSPNRPKRGRTPPPAAGGLNSSAMHQLPAVLRGLSTNMV